METEKLKKKLEFLTTQELEKYKVICHRQYVLSQDRCFGIMRDYLATEYQRRTKQ